MVAIWGELTGVPVAQRILPYWFGWAMLPFTLLAAS